MEQYSKSSTGFLLPGMSGGLIHHDVIGGAGGGGLGRGVVFLDLYVDTST